MPSPPIHRRSPDTPNSGSETGVFDSLLAILLNEKQLDPEDRVATLLQNSRMAQALAEQIDRENVAADPLSRLLPESRAKRWALFITFWTVVALVSAAYFWTWRRMAGLTELWTWPMLIVAKVLVWYVWALVTLLILKLGRKFRPEGTSWLRWGLIHLGFSIAIVGLYMIYYTVSLLSLRSASLELESLSANFGLLSSWHQSFFFLAYWAIIGIDYALDYYRRYRERELRTMQLERRLAQAQVDALRAQLQPHFLFNTLHMISTLMHRDAASADRMLTKLSDMLRMTLKNVDRQEITLNEELELTRLYLEIQRSRFKDRLQIEVAVPSELYDAQVPNLLLQPLVENAIQHGVAPHSNQALVRIAAVRSNGSLTLTVEDNGPGLPENWSLETSRIGLTNTRERLRQLYGENYSFELASRPEGGVAAVVRLPLVTAAAASTPPNNGDE